MLENDDSRENFAHWLALVGGALLSITGFLAIFGVNYTLGKGNFIAFLLMLVLGAFIALIEMDSDFIPKKYSFLFKNTRIKAFTYFVVGVMLISSGIASILLIISAILYYL